MRGAADSGKNRQFAAKVAGICRNLPRLAGLAASSRQVLFLHLFKKWDGNWRGVELLVMERDFGCW